MLVKVDENKSAARVIFAGRVTGDSFEEMNLRLAKMDMKAAKEVILDLGLVQSINSSGIGKLAALNKRLTVHAVSLSLVNVPKNIYDLLTAIKIQELIPITAKSAN